MKTQVEAEKTFKMDGITFTVSKITHEAKDGTGAYNESFKVEGRTVVAFHSYDGAFKKTSYYVHLNGGFRKFYSMKSMTCAILGAKFHG